MTWAGETRCGGWPSPPDRLRGIHGHAYLLDALADPPATSMSS
jgi:hypothetical protein